MIIRALPSPNHNDRAVGDPDMLILHYTDTVDAGEALELLTSRAAEVSAHYLVDTDGTVIHMVHERKRAWHAGRGTWRTRGDINSRSIGIEVQNPGHRCGLEAFPDVQIASLIALCQRILARWPIRPDLVLGHSDIAPTRKRDPGELFPWARLARAGIGLYPPDLTGPGGRISEGMRGPLVFRLQTDLARFGYAVPMTATFCPVTTAVVLAFQRHYHPEQLDGVWTGTLQAKLAWLIKQCPIDG